MACSELWPINSISSRNVSPENEPGKVNIQTIAGSAADTRYVTEEAFSKATRTDDKQLFLVEGATHIETYFVDEYVDAVLGQLTAFYASAQFAVEVLEMSAGRSFGAIRPRISTATSKRCRAVLSVRAGPKSGRAGDARRH